MNFFFVNSSFSGLHEVDLGRLFKDGLGDLKGLVKIGLDEGISELLPVCCGKHKLLELFLVFGGYGGTAFDGMLFKAFLSLDVGVLNDDFRSFKEIVEGHCAVLLVLGLAKFFAFSNELVNNFFGGLCPGELSLFLRFFLSDHNATEAFQLFVVFQVVVSRSLSEVGKIKTKLY